VHIGIIIYFSRCLTGYLSLHLSAKNTLKTRKPLTRSVFKP
jgi:hypothetical protein